ncbi:MAG: hypothetical protein WBQ75_13945 [Acetobacteraceae bacterium]
MIASPATENKARIGRVTCGRHLPQLDIARVRRFWRDVHSPAIARRSGIWEYRHNQFGDVRADLFPPIAGITSTCDRATQLRWQSDVRYADQAGPDAFGADPGPAVKSHLLSDIDMLVDRSTTYLVLGESGRTYIDRTADAAPQGAPASASYGLFFRQRGGQAGFRACLRTLADRWADHPGVLRLRLSLFEVPDMEAERKAGYPIKTHPPEQQYQAWIDISLADNAVAATLMPPGDGIDPAAAIAEIHAYPAEVVHTFNQAGHPTLTGLRGYAAYEAIGFFDAAQHRQESLLRWMYGDVARECAA